MLNFNYTLDSELEVPVGRIPSGIQTQALEMAINRIGRRYRTTKKLLSKQVPGLGRGPVAGMSEVWQLRLISESRFLDAMPPAIYSRAGAMVDSYRVNAALQGEARRVWNGWSQKVIKDYALAVAAFEREVALAMKNGPSNGLPPAMVRLAKTVGVPTPVLLDAKAAGLESIPEVDDPDYLAELEAASWTPMILGGIAGAAAIGLVAWWFSRPGAAAATASAAGKASKAARVTQAAMAGLGDEVDPYYGRPWMIGPKFTTQSPRKPVNKCIRYAYTPSGKKRCVKYARIWATPEGHRVSRPRRWRSDCPGCFPRRTRFRGRGL